MLVGAVLVTTLATLALAAPASATVGRTTGSACLPGHWKVDVQQLVATSSVTGTLAASGSLDVTFSRTHKFLQTYAYTITGTGPTVTIEDKYNGAVAATFRATSRTITLTAIDNATSKIQTVTVSGHSAAPTTTTPAPGSFPTGGTSTVGYTCRNRTMTISIPGGVLHLNKVG